MLGVKIHSRFSSWRATILSVALASVTSISCHRAVEPFDPEEQVEAPDLARIFPPGAESAPTGTPGLPDLAAAARPESAQGIAGTIDLAPGSETPNGAVLFIIARAGPSGPPAAVKRVSAPKFPHAFEIGPADRMIEGIPWSGPFRISARLDGDGNATTRDEGDLLAESSSGVAPGARGVRLRLEAAP